MNLTQLERIKSELKRENYEENKVQGPIGKIHEPLGAFLQETEGI
jgi:hypothetical protein